MVVICRLFFFPDSRNSTSIVFTHFVGFRSHKDNLKLWRCNLHNSISLFLLSFLVTILETQSENELFKVR